MLKTEAIVEVLKYSNNQYLSVLYNSNMEVQVNVAKDDGERFTDTYQGRRWTGWINNSTSEKWKSFRIPWNANSIPEYTDKNISFNLSAHVEGIGMTGWDWVNKQSLYVGFDFDSIINHKEGLSNEELERIKTILNEIDYVTIIKSTSGKGLHIYIFIEKGFTTNNHTEHAALARSLLNKLSMEVGYNLQISVDACGGVLWIYHRKQEGTDGLSLIKKGNELPIDRIPKNWKEHINICSGKTKKTNITFDDSTIKYVTLGSEHIKLLQWFNKNSTLDNWWDSDHNMLVCHTFDLKKAHKELQLKGFFETNSSGSSEQNCFAFPLLGGGWVIRRHGQNIREHLSWGSIGGWTTCYYNMPIDLETGSRIHGGVENSSGEFVFQRLDSGLKTVLAITNIELDVLDHYKNREASLKEKNGKLILSVDREKSDVPLDGFVQNKRGNKWERVIRYDKEYNKDIQAPDNLIRHIISNDCDAGWYIHINNKWVLHPKSDIQTVLLGETNSYVKSDIDLMLSESILNPWELVNIPFSDEYPGNRMWNKGAAALYYSRIDIEQAKESFNTWLSLLNHLGKNLNDSILNDLFCIENAVKTGGEYLLLWVASMLQRPYEPLPYLFLVGEQNTGKSTLHEAIGRFILKRGYTRADNALINSAGFNAEIANAVLCIIEETDLRKNKDAANRLKDWVTGKTIQVNQKYKTPYDINNTTKWIQCANDTGYCPVFQGDTRIIIIHIDPPEKEIPKDQLFKFLESETKSFLNYLLSLELPNMPGRLALPCIQTYEKNEIQLQNMNDLESFIQIDCEICKGNLISFDEFLNKFKNSLPTSSLDNWTQNKTARYFPKQGIVCKGKYGEGNKTFVANLKFKDDIEIIEQNFIWKINHLTGRLEKIC